MRTHAKGVVALLALTFALCTSATVANSQSSIQTSPAAVNGETEALSLELRIERLLSEVKAGRALVTAQRNELSAAEAQLEAEKQSSASLEKSKALAEGEIYHLRDSILYQQQVIASKAETIAVLKAANDQLKRDLSKSRKRAFWATAATAVVTGLVFLK